MEETENRPPLINHVISQGILAVIALVAMYLFLGAYHDIWTIGEWLHLLFFLAAWLSMSSNVYNVIRLEDRTHNFSGCLIVVFSLMALMICAVSTSDQMLQGLAVRKGSDETMARNNVDYCFLPALCVMFNILVCLYYRLSVRNYLAALATFLPRRRTGVSRQKPGTDDPQSVNREPACDRTAGAGREKGGASGSPGVEPRIMESIFVPLGNLAAISGADGDEERNYIAGVMTRLRLSPGQRQLAHKQVEFGRTCAPSAAFRRISHSALAAEGSEFHERAFRLAAGILFAGGPLQREAQKRFDMAADAFHVSRSSREEIRGELATLFRRSGSASDPNLNQR